MQRQTTIVIDGQMYSLPVHSYLEGPGHKSITTLHQHLLTKNKAAGQRKHWSYDPDLVKKMGTGKHLTQEARRVQKLENKLAKASGERANQILIQLGAARKQQQKKSAA